MMFLLSPASAIAGVLVSGILVALILRHRSKPPLPPGPRGLALLRYLLRILVSKRYPWDIFTEWSHKWGGINSVTLLGRTIIIINDAKIAEDLLTNEDSTYCDRPTLQMPNLSGYKYTVGTIGAGKRHEDYRKMLDIGFGHDGEGVQKYHAMEEYQARKLVQRILNRVGNTPSYNHVLRAKSGFEACLETIGGIIFWAGYGYKIQDHDDPFLARAEQARHDLNTAAESPKYALLNQLPSIRHLPAWLPFQRTAARFRKNAEALREEPFQSVRALETVGKIPSLVSDVLSSVQAATVAVSEPQTEYLKWTAMTLYGAGAQPTSTVLHAYFLAMCQHPEIQDKVRDELDSVTGGARLPTFADRPRLPYLAALCKELFRWFTVVPLGIPHRSLRGGVYNGFRIPAGSIVFTNVWHVLHDPGVYRDPDNFNPERFLGSEPEPDPWILFGFGSRVCPGNHIAQDSVWISVAHLAFTVDIRAKDGESMPQAIPDKISTVIHPLPFECTVKPRLQDVLSLTT